MAGGPARTVLAALLAGIFAGLPASASDKEVQVERACKLARDGTFASSQSQSQKIELCNQRVSGVAVRSSVLSAWGT